MTVGESRYVHPTALLAHPILLESSLYLDDGGMVANSLDHRQELLAWLNNLLQLNMTKIEQCGTGYAPNPISFLTLDHTTSQRSWNITY